jgi:N6-adenosine-specific RNA methylase IME4
MQATSELANPNAPTKPPPTHPDPVVRLEAACTALLQATRLDEVKLIRDQAQAVRHLLREQGYAREIQQQAGELKLRAERRLGELLAGMPKHNGDPRSHDVTRLADLGIGKMDSHRWQRIAAVPEETFEAHLAHTCAAGEELTTAGVLRLAAQVRKAEADASARSVSSGCCTVDDLHELVRTGQRFGTLYLDPPWRYELRPDDLTHRGRCPYPTMALDEIASLPVAELAADKSLCHLWTTNGFIEEALQLLRTWGFAYKSMFVWCKPQIGLGHYWRVSHEFLLLGVKGNCAFLEHDMKSWEIFDRGRHSSKPEQVRLAVERVSPGPRLELFARDTAEGWTVWGNQIERTLFNREAMAS